MQEKKHPVISWANRRRFISNALKLTVLGSLLTPLEQACNIKKPSDNNNKPPEPVIPEKKNKQPRSASKKNRKKWSHETLVINSKTNVMHFPTSKIYGYYDEIKPNHLQEISLATWASQLQGPVRLNKQQSGTILEILAMQNLRQGINDQSLTSATDTLSRAFTTACENSKGVNLNTTNFRLHELMLQLITLNTTIPASNKWQFFNDKIKKPVALRKRQKWMETETNFNERLKYIQDRQNDYIIRLTKRASRYSFT